MSSTIKEPQKKIATDQPKETIEPKVDSSPKSVNDLMTSLAVPREEVKPPPFLEDMDFVDSDPIDDKIDSDKSVEENNGLTDDDEANLSYLDYSEEDKTAATWIIMTVDKVMDFSAKQISKDNTVYRKFSKKDEIDEEYLDVTAALVKKYKVILSLEAILGFTLLTIYAPTLSGAYSKRVLNEARLKKEANNGKS